MLVYYFIVGNLSIFNGYEINISICLTLKMIGTFRFTIHFIDHCI
jgi:hypothetical protein